MNKKSKYNQNFDKAIMKAMKCDSDEIENFKFKLVPFDESKGKESSRDTWVNNTKLKNNNLAELKSYEDAIWLLSAGASTYPLWIHVTKLNDREIQLKFSKRFRHLKTSHNQDTGHPPFKIVSEFNNLGEKANILKNELIASTKLIEITEMNLDSLVLPTSMILYFLVDWSGYERMARYKIFNYLKSHSGNAKLYFVDGSTQNRSFFSRISIKFNENLEYRCISGYGPIIYMSNKIILDEMKQPHTLENETIHAKLSSWLESIKTTNTNHS